METPVFIYNSVGFMTTHWTNVYDHLDYELDPRLGEVHSIQHDVIKFVSDLLQFGGFRRVLYQ